MDCLIEDNVGNALNLNGGRFTNDIVRNCIFRGNEIRTGTGGTRGAAIGHISPEAMQKGPIAIVKACLPCAPDFLKRLSILKATLGR